MHVVRVWGTNSGPWCQQRLLQCEWGTGFRPLWKSTSTWCVCGAPTLGPGANSDCCSVSGHRLWALVEVNEHVVRVWGTDSGP